MQKLLVSTDNINKLRELGAMVDTSRYELVSKAAAGLSGVEITEDGDTLEANARLKVLGLSRAMAERGISAEDYWIVGDDTGLFIDALDGAPGIYSARYSGSDGDSEKNIDKVLAELDGVSEDARGAHFETVIALLHDEQIRIFRGRMDGHITDSRRGEGGFGYDAIFFIDEAGCTGAQLSTAEKNRYSHRGAAYRELSAYLER